MDPAGPASGGRRTGFVRWWLIPTAVVVVSTAIALPLVSSDARTPVAVCGVVATLVVALATAEAERRGRAASELFARHAEHQAAWERRLAAQEAEMVRLAGLLPQAVARLQQGEYAEDVLTDIEAEKSLSPQVRAAHATALRSVVEAVQNAEDLRVSAERGFVNIARRVQAIIHQQARSLREMEDRHGRRHEFFADLLKLDHGTALVGRLADSIAVLGGDRPGRQWGKAIALYSVLRGGMSRIIDYQRVELHPVAEVAVVGSAVEPLIHAVAELLDNATRYSPPHAKVHLSATEVQSGVAIEIEDGGVGLSEEARERAEHMLAEAQAGIDLNDLGESPRLGLAVVGRLAQTYDFRVSLRPSAYGGVRAVVVVPQVLLTTTPATGAAHGIGATSGPRPLRDSTPPSAGVAGSGGTREGVRSRTDRVPLSRQAGPQPSPPVHAEPVSGSLPQRRRRAPAVPPDTPAAGGVAGRRTATAYTTGTDNGGAESGAVEPGLWLGEFTRGLEGEGPAADAAPAPAGGQPREAGRPAPEEGVEEVGEISPERSARAPGGDGAAEPSNPSSGEEG